MDELSNEQRAAWGKVALQAYLKAKNEKLDLVNVSDDYVDLLKDILHAAHSQNLDIEEIVVYGEKFFLEETPDYYQD